MNEITAKYRTLFLKSGTIGKDVLGDILTMCHFGCTLDPDNKVQVSEYNVGVAVMNRLGILDKNTLEQVVTNLANVTPQEEPK